MDEMPYMLHSDNNKIVHIELSKLLLFPRPNHTASGASSMFDDRSARMSARIEDVDHTQAPMYFILSLSAFA